MNDMPSCFKQEERKAKKAHKCQGCSSEIKAGEKYTYSSGVWGGIGKNFKHCRNCAQIVNNFQLFDDNCSIDEGPLLGDHGVIEWFMGYVCDSYTIEEMNVDLMSIFDLDENYLRSCIRFKDYWKTRSSINYDEMVEAEAAFKFQASLKPKWSDVRFKLPKAEEKVIAYRVATKEQIAIDKEYDPVIFAALDPDRVYVWYDWESGKDIDPSLFTVTHWMTVDCIGEPQTNKRK